jgi:hypothetical protein
MPEPPQRLRVCQGSVLLVNSVGYAPLNGIKGIVKGAAAAIVLRAGGRFAVRGGLLGLPLCVGRPAPAGRLILPLAIAKIVPSGNFTRNK